MTRPALLVVLVGVVAGFLGCGRTVSDADCRRVAAVLHDVWDAESKKASTEGVAAEKAAAVIRGEGDRLSADWSIECKKDLAGRRVDPQELDCLLAAKTIEQVNQCTQR